MDHSVEMITSILAVLKTGAAYVPAEPSFPIERIRYMMKESGVAMPSFPMTPSGKVDRKSLPVVLREGALYA